MGWPDQALALATRLVALDEFDEEANILMIRTYLAIGAEQRAREHLESAAARIRDELGTEPSPALMLAIDNASQFALPSQSWVEGSAAGESLITAGDAAVSAGVFDAGLEILRRAVVVAREAGDAELEAGPSSSLNSIPRTRAAGAAATARRRCMPACRLPSACPPMASSPKPVASSATST